jgi:GT2 family glycosyltransferase
MKIGEDIDLTFRLWESNFETQFIENAFVYHKRRSTFQQFFKQTFAFGQGRPLLNKKYPKTAKITYWFPTLFIIGFIFSILSLFLGISLFVKFYGFYLFLVFLDSYAKNKNLEVALTSILTTLIQFTGYGLGFLKGLLNS